MKRKQIHEYRELVIGREEVAGKMRKISGLKRKTFQLYNNLSHEVMIHRLDNTVDNSVLTLNGDRWELDIMVIISLCM